MFNPNSWNLPFLSNPSWHYIFGNDAPLELEIGMGRSHFLFERAKTVPGHNIIGIEWKGEWVKQARKRADREKVPNVHAIFANAWEVVPVLFEPGSLSQIILNFPDPWWKKRHYKRKVMNDAFVDILVSKLKEGGRIYLATDVKELFDEYLELCEQNSALFNLAGVGKSFTENLQGARSHREKKCSADGVPIYRAWLEKRVK
jgi:tRNA (guanine-N7-)-methyltransferase